MAWGNVWLFTLAFEWNDPWLLFPSILRPRRPDGSTLDGFTLDEFALDGSFGPFSWLPMFSAFLFIILVFASYNVVLPSVWASSSGATVITACFVSIRLLDEYITDSCYRMLIAKYEGSEALRSMSTQVKCMQPQPQPKASRACTTVHKHFARYI